MNDLLSCLSWLFNIMALMCKWGFLLLSVFILYKSGSVQTLTDWLLILTLLFAILVTICEIFAMLRVRLPNMYLTYAKRIRNPSDE